jgi:hypothetical protein
METETKRNDNGKTQENLVSEYAETSTNESTVNANPAEVVADTKKSLAETVEPTVDDTDTANESTNTPDSTVITTAESTVTVNGKDKGKGKGDSEGNTKPISAITVADIKPTLTANTLTADNTAQANHPNQIIWNIIGNIENIIGIIDTAKDIIKTDISITLENLKKAYEYSNTISTSGLYDDYPKIKKSQSLIFQTIKFHKKLISTVESYYKNAVALDTKTQKSITADCNRLQSRYNQIAGQIEKTVSHIKKSPFAAMFGVVLALAVVVLIVVMAQSKNIARLNGEIDEYELKNQQTSASSETSIARGEYNALQKQFDDLTFQYNALQAQIEQGFYGDTQTADIESLFSGAIDVRIAEDNFSFVSIEGTAVLSTFASETSLSSDLLSLYFESANTSDLTVVCPVAKTDLQNAGLDLKESESSNDTQTLDNIKVFGYLTGKNDFIRILPIAISFDNKFVVCNDTFYQIAR